VNFGGRAEVVDSAITANRGVNVEISGQNSSANLTRTLVFGRWLDSSSPMGVWLAEGRLHLHQSAVVANMGEGILIARQAEAYVSESLVGHTQALNLGSVSRGIQVQQDAVLYLERSTLMNNLGWALAVVEPLTGGAATADVKDSLALGSVSPNEDWPQMGFVVQGGDLSLLRTAIVNSAGGALVSRGLGTAYAHRVLLADSFQTQSSLQGFGALADSGSLMVLRETEVRSNAGAGIGVSQSSLAMEGGRLLGNTVGLHVDDGVRLREVVSIQAPFAGEEVQLSKSTVFLNNGLKVSAGLLQLPDLELDMEKH
jgi:hypothetical protein